jgi:hypothetical protein
VTTDTFPSSNFMSAKFETNVIELKNFLQLLLL